MKLYTDSLHKIAYATDASVYREIPYGVAYPETLEEIQKLMCMAKDRHIHLIPRAGGTSIAGQVVGSGIVVDISKHWNHILEISHILYNFSTCLKIRGVFQREAILPQHFHNNFNFCES